MQITNKIENIIIATVAMIVTVAVFGLYNHFFVLKPLQKELIAQREAIIKLAEIPKYAIQNDFEKMRTKKGGSITLDLNNELNHLELEAIKQDTIKQDTIQKAPEKTIWEKIFKKRD